jgi:hypothetical protein
MAKWTAPDVARTVAEIQACKDGMAHADEMWPPPEAGQDRPKPQDFVKPAEKTQATAAKVEETNNKPEPAAGASGKPEPTAAKASVASPKVAQPTPTDDKPAASEPNADARREEEPCPPDDMAVELEQEPSARDEPLSDDEPAGEDPSPAEDAAQEAFLAFEKEMGERGEWATALALTTSPVAIDKLAVDFRALLNGNIDLTEEDKAVLAGRWNTMCLEHKRRITPRGKRK